MSLLEGGFAPESGGTDQSGVAKRTEHDIDGQSFGEPGQRLRALQIGGTAECLGMSTQSLEADCAIPLGVVGP